MIAPKPPRNKPDVRGAPAFRAGRALRLILLAGLAALLCLYATACGQEETPQQKPKPAASATAPAPAPTPVPVQPNTATKPAKADGDRTATAPRRFLVVGDSLSISLGEQLEHALAGTPGLDFTRDGTRSTGLTRPELLDWPARLRELTAKAAPDVAVIMLGANDIMPLIAKDGSRTYFDNPAWAEAYAAKARELVRICRESNPKAAISWVGVPSMGEASLAAGVKQVNAALAAMCVETGCRFINTEVPFSDPEGRFTRHARDAATGETVPIRTADGVHLTDTGAKLLAGVVLTSLAGRELLPPSAGADELRAQARDIRPVADEARPPSKEAAAVKVKAKPKVRASRKTYAVRGGDTFHIIGKRLGLDPDDIADVNPGADSRRLSIGQTLRLPVKR